MIIESHGHRIEIKIGGVLPPDSKSNMNTGCKTWYKYDNHEWFQPYGNFSQRQVIKMIGLCENEYQLNSLMELLSAISQEKDDGSYCQCEFAMVRRDQETQKAYCFECKKEIKE